MQLETTSLFLISSLLLYSPTSSDTLSEKTPGDMSIENAPTVAKHIETIAQNELKEFFDQYFINEATL